MHPEASLHPSLTGTRRRPQEPPLVRWTLITLAVGVVTLLVIIPVVNVFYQAFSNGLAAYWRNLTGDRDTLHSIWLTLMIAPAAVALNLVFGVAAAWAVTRFQFHGRAILTTIIDLPFAVSPVVAGLCFLLLFGMKGYFGPWLRDNWGIMIPYNWPGILLATTFVTLPFIARELIPVMEAVGSDEETAAVSLGADGWQMFWRVTVPNIKWGLLYGVILCNARAMGEFGAVAVLSGRTSGRTATMPLRVEQLWQDISAKSSAASFSLASLLTFLALITLILKVYLEHKTRRELAEAAAAVADQTAPQ